MNVTWSELIDASVRRTDASAMCNLNRDYLAIDAHLWRRALDQELNDRVGWVIGCARCGRRMTSQTSDNTTQNDALEVCSRCMAVLVMQDVRDVLTELGALETDARIDEAVEKLEARWGPGRNRDWDGAA